jgi:hypothetical protein
MSLLFAAKIWHYWIGIGLLAITILVVIGLVIGYIVKVSSIKYPKQ